MLSRILPESLTMILWALLLIGTALYMGVFNPSSATHGAKKLFQLLAMVFLLYGVSLFIGGISGASSLMSVITSYSIHYTKLYERFS